MGLFERIKEWLSRPEPLVIAPGSADEASVRTPSGRVYHELFLGEHESDGKWTARAYGGGRVREESGTAADRADAKAEALAWAARAKQDLIGD